MPEDRPYRGESFADFARRVGPAPATPRRQERAEPPPFPGLDANARARESWRGRSLQPTRPPRVRIHRDMREVLRTPPAEYRGPTSMNLREIPIARNPVTREPRPGQGLIQWGADGRREWRDIQSDVERVSGAPPGLLSGISARESAGGVHLDNPKSSVYGPHHFSPPTWAGFMGFAGARYGLAATTAPDEVLWLREDARWSGAMTAEYARTNWHRFRNRLGQSPTQGELYAMHFGDARALNLLVDYHRKPERRSAAADVYFTPGERAANEPVFYPALGGGRYDRQRPFTVQQFHDRMSQGFAVGAVDFGPRMDGSDDYLN